MSDWETLAPNAPSSGGWETLTPNRVKPVPSGLLDQAANTFKKYGVATPIAAPIVMAGQKMFGGLNEVSDMAGSGVTELSSRAGLSPETSAALGVLANYAVNSAVPIAIGKGVSALASPAMESAATRLMQSAVKPDLAARKSGNAAKAIQTMLDERINATAGGLEQTQGKIGALEDTIQNILDQSPATVDKFEVAKNLKNAVSQVNLNLDRAQNIKDIQDAFNKFWNHDALKNLGNDIPVSLANKMKQAFYKELMDKVYQPGVQVSAADKAQKALAAGLRQQIANAEPAVVDPLAEQSKLINVAKVLSPRVAVEGNKNIIGLGALSPSVSRFLAFMLDRYPWVKSELAHAAYSGSERIPAEIAGGLTAAGLQAQQNEQK